MFEIVCVTNRKLCRENFLLRLEMTAYAAPDRIILREKDLPEAEYSELAAKAMEICRRYSVPLILHNFAETAARLGAETVHLPMRVLRELSTERKLCFRSIGTSCHSSAEIHEAKLLGADYAAGGHIFETSCKDGLPPRGLDFLRSAVETADLPIFAIGGITPENIGYTAECGAYGACVMSGAMTCDSPEKYIRSLREGVKL